MLGQQKGLFALSLFFGAFVNILIFTGPIFALQVYDRVLSSRSKETLVVLCLLMIFLFVVMGVLDHIRKRIAARIGERFISELEHPIFQAISTNPQTQEGAPLVQDLETIRQFFASPLFTALGDLIWVPVFFLGLSVLHPTLGWMCLAGGVAFLIPGVWNLAIQDSARPEDQPDYQAAATLADITRCGGDQAHGVSPAGGLYTLWKSLRQRARIRALWAQDHRAALASAAQTFRTLLQSLTIAVGAYLVLQDQLTPGAIIAATVLLARALGPLDLISQNTPSLRGMLHAWRRISRATGSHCKIANGKQVIAPQLQVNQVTVFPPHHRRAALRMVDFELRPGSTLGVLGRSASGKSTLARAIAGIWPVAGGTLLVGKSPVGRLDPGMRARNIGYLPQNIWFLSATIGQNISGFDTDESQDKLIASTRITGAHDSIMALPDGYETTIDPNSPPFAAGMLQRIALARALYHVPPIVILDEPENNLDQDGAEMLQRIVLEIKASGRIAVILSQDLSVLRACHQILELEAGAQTYFGLTPAKQAEPNRARIQGYPASLSRITP